MESAPCHYNRSAFVGPYCQRSWDELLVACRSHACTRLLPDAADEQSRRSTFQQSQNAKYACWQESTQCDGSGWHFGRRRVLSKR